jgi:hypothetical protein
MKRLSTILLLLFIAHSVFAQRKSRNAPQSFLAIETGVPILNKNHSDFLIPLNIEWQRKKKQWGFGASIGLQYDRYSSGDCSRRYTVNSIRDVTGFVDSYRYRPYCETSQYLDLNPTIFGSYYFIQKKKLNVFVKLGCVGNIPIIARKEGEYYEVETLPNGSMIVKNPDPIHISKNIPTYQKTRIGLLSGLAVNYFLNKRTALRFTLQSELYSHYWNNDGSLLFALGGITFKI